MQSMTWVPCKALRFCLDCAVAEGAFAAGAIAGERMLRERLDAALSSPGGRMTVDTYSKKLTSGDNHGNAGPRRRRANRAGRRHLLCARFHRFPAVRGDDWAVSARHREALSGSAGSRVS